jgi:general secretion pathway protein N
MMRALNWPLCLAGAFCLGLLIVIGAESLPRGSAEDDPVPVSGGVRASVGAQPVFAMPPISAYAPVLARPLFSPTRRPSAQAGALPASSSFTLVAIVISADDRHALLGSGQPIKVTRVAEGEDIGGWTVEAILPDRVIVRRGDQHEEIKPKDAKKIVGAPTSLPASVVVGNGQGVGVAQPRKAHDE